MYVPVYDVELVRQYIMAGISRYQWGSGVVEEAGPDGYDRRCAENPTHMFMAAVKNGQYGIVVED